MANTDLRYYFNTILTKGVKDNTYKFALARFLLDYSQNLTKEQIYAKLKNNEPETVDYQQIANAFLKYYWHQECKYRIRQNHNDAKPPSVVTTIRHVFGEHYIHRRFSEMPADIIKEAQNEIRKKVFGKEKSKTSQVIPRFQNIREGNSATGKPVFYDYDDNAMCIRIKPQALEFFNQNYTTLFKSVILEWAKFLEKINTLPRLIAKIESAEVKRTSLRKYVHIFRDFRHCFYCNCVLENDDTHVDHFIPWSYIFEDESWNLVMTCSGCNSKKSDSLASSEFLDEIIKRNKTYRDRIAELHKSLTGLDVGKGWEGEIRKHYENCKEYGFSVIRL